MFFSCTSHKCLELFIAAYSKDDSNFYDDMFYYRGSAPYKAHPVQFESTILEISESFSEIYNQAKEAEDRDLDQICGVGYRKALEFLIKDYAILINPENEEQIKREFLNGVITNYIHSEKIKEISKRAVWIGNDETHYIRKWDNKDINDLKILIKLTTNWITNEVLSKNYIEEMN